MSDKPTKGTWVVGASDTDKWAYPAHDDKDSTSAQEIVCDGEVVAFAVVAYDGWSHPRKEARLSNNARLIAEAGTVYHETGLTPRELAERVKELEQHISALLYWDNGKSEFQAARAALATQGDKT